MQRFLNEGPTEAILGNGDEQQIAKHPSRRERWKLWLEPEPPDASADHRQHQTDDRCRNKYGPGDGAQIRTRSRPARQERIEQQAGAGLVEVQIEGIWPGVGGNPNGVEQDRVVKTWDEMCPQCKGEYRGKHVIYGEGPLVPRGQVKQSGQQ